MKKFLATICAVALLMADCGQFVETINAQSKRLPNDTQ